MRVATEEFFCYVVLLLLNWSWSYNFGLGLGLIFLVLVLVLQFWSWSYSFGLDLGLNILVLFPSLKSRTIADIIIAIMSSTVYLWRGFSSLIKLGQCN